MHVAHLIYTHDRDLRDPDALLDRYSTLTGWSDALVGAGVERTTVLVAFWRDALVQRGQVRYHFVRPVLAWPQVFTSGRLHRVLATLGPDVLHVNGLSFTMETWRLRREFPHTPILLQDHADRPPRHPARRALRRVGLRAADGFLFAAAQQVEPWRAAGLIGADTPVFEVMESSTRFEPIGRRRARAMTGLPGRPAVTCEIIFATASSSRSDVIPVSGTSPGATAFTVMFLDASSRARLLVKPTSPALEAA